MTYGTEIRVASHVYSMLRASFYARIAFPAIVRLDVVCPSELFVYVHYVARAYFYAFTTSITYADIYKSWHLLLYPSTTSGRSLIPLSLSILSRMKRPAL